ncbi:MAG: AAA family ATPase [Lentisphaeria bacterium]|nr:AAA family ATPase [Lentisphaeria bacterium]
MKTEVTLAEAKQIIMSMGTNQSILMLASPGVGKSDIVQQIADTLGYECRSLLGTQIAPEDISGIPRIEGEGDNQRSVFYPPKLLLPADGKPFVLFLDELPICNQEVQKAMYSLLLDRKIGERKLPKGTIVVAAGNNIEDSAMVRAMSTALVNRVIILHIKVSVKEWLEWGSQIDDNGKTKVRDDIRAFIAANDFCLQYKDPDTGSKVPSNANEPFSTPRSWAALSAAMDALEEFRKNPAARIKSIYGKKVDKSVSFLQNAEADGLTEKDVEVLARGSISAQHADAFCTYKKYNFQEMKPAEYYIEHPDAIPQTSGEDLTNSSKIFERAIIFDRIQQALANPDSSSYKAIKKLGGKKIDAFFCSMPKEFMIILAEKVLKTLQQFGATETIARMRLQ